MNADKVKALLRQQLPIKQANFHSITPDSIDSFLVEPYAVHVDPDDLETEPRNMWVVLEEKGDCNYLIAYDPPNNAWAVIEKDSKGAFVQVVSGDTFEKAMVSM